MGRSKRWQGGCRGGRGDITPGFIPRRSRPPVRSCRSPLPPSRRYPAASVAPSERSAASCELGNAREALGPHRAMHPAANRAADSSAAADRLRDRRARIRCRCRRCRNKPRRSSPARAARAGWHQLRRRQSEYVVIGEKDGILHARRRIAQRSSLWRCCAQC